MKTNKLQILKSGMLTSVQDMGRPGFQSSGMPVAGAMDGLSLQLANIAVGNAPNTACIEATLAGPEILFADQTYFCICGAEMQARLNDSPLKNGQPVLAHKNDILKMGFATRGCRAYIAFSGGIDVPLIMESRSTFIAGKMGGYKGRNLIAGDTLSLGQVNGKPLQKDFPDDLLTGLFSIEPIRILPGPEINFFRSDAIKTLLNGKYTVSPDSNRMGYRLDGAKITTKTNEKEIISSPVPKGCIQVPPNGQPVILMADRQTTGGYPRIAVVATIDHPRLGQLKPGDQLGFEEIGLKEAQNLLIARENRLKNLCSTD
jgi:antagonist of KipI